MTSPTSEDFRPRLFISQRAAKESAFKVLLVPTDDGWNDFGHRVAVRLGIRNKSDIEWFNARLAIDGYKNTRDRFIERMAAVAQGIEISALEASYAFLLSEAKSYAMLRSHLTLPVASEVLTILHDISLLDSEKALVPGWPNFFNSPVFSLAMVRSSECYFAYRRGQKILNGISSGEADARRPFEARFSKGNSSLVYKFKFDMTNSLRGRIAVVIGSNGCGKTYSLTRIARGLVNSKAKGCKISPRHEINQVLAFAHPKSLALFSRQNKLSGSALIRTFALDVGEWKPKKNYESNTRLLVDLFRSWDEDGPVLQNLIEILEEEFPRLKLHVPVLSNASYVDKHGRGYSNIRSWMRGSEQRNLEAASEVDHSRELIYLNAAADQIQPSVGQLTFIRFAMNVIANAGTASAIMIDEPENFLHPNLISRFMRILNRVLKKTKSIAIVATHSPFVVREVQSAQVHIISIDELGAAVVKSPRLQTLGANVASISSEVFGDDLPEHLYEELLSNAEVEGLSVGQMLDKYSGELSTEALMALRTRLEQDNEED